MRYEGLILQSFLSTNCNSYNILWSLSCIFTILLFSSWWGHCPSFVKARTSLHRDLCVRICWNLPSVVLWRSYKFKKFMTQSSEHFGKRNLLELLALVTWKFIHFLVEKHARHLDNLSGKEFLKNHFGSEEPSIIWLDLPVQSLSLFDICRNKD